MSSNGQGRGGARGGRGGATGTGPPGRRGRQQPEVGPDGKEINPYIPRYISNAPWYLEKSEDYLEHQRSHKDENFKGEWYDRGKKSTTKVTKFRKGACTNCGSIAHKAIDCLERPRKVGAKYTSQDMRDEEKVNEIQTTWDSKRDRWNGYDADEYQQVVKKFEQDEASKEQEKQEEIVQEKARKEQAHTPDTTESSVSQKKKTAKDDYGLDSLDGDDDDSDDEDQDSPRKDGSTTQTTRSLRVREDKARYLQDLSEDAAVFNPKSRTLRTEEEGTINERGQFIRKLTDKAEEHKRYAELADEAAERGESIHLEKGPTASLMMFRKLEQEKQDAQALSRKKLLEKYGGEEYMDSNRPKEVEETPVEDYIEYTATGNVKTKPQEDETDQNDDQNNNNLPIADNEREEIVKSKYEEDIYNGNHTSVWGSYWKDFKWGYSCCHSLIKQSYCTGAVGRDVNDGSKNSRSSRYTEEEEDNGTRSESRKRKYDTEESDSRKKSK